MVTVFHTRSLQQILTGFSDKEIGALETLDTDAGQKGNLSADSFGTHKAVPYLLVGQFRWIVALTISLTAP